jgi:hypothetical protein
MNLAIASGARSDPFDCAAPLRRLSTLAQTRLQHEDSDISPKYFIGVNGCGQGLAGWYSKRVRKA